MIKIRDITPAVFFRRFQGVLEQRADILDQHDDWLDQAVALASVSR